MDKKKIIIIVGVLALAGIGYYIWNKSREKKDADSSDNQSGDKTSSVTTGSSSVGNNSESNIDTEESKEQNSSGKNIKDLKGKEKREFRKETRDICKEKYGKGKDYRDCKKRLKSGGVAFIGDFDDFNNDYIDFKGQVNNQYLFSSIQNDFGVNMDI